MRVMSCATIPPAPTVHIPHFAIAHLSSGNPTNGPEVIRCSGNFFELVIRGFPRQRQSALPFSSRAVSPSSSTVNTIGFGSSCSVAPSKDRHSCLYFLLSLFPHNHVQTIP